MGDCLHGLSPGFDHGIGHALSIEREWVLENGVHRRALLEEETWAMMARMGSQGGDWKDPEACARADPSGR
jgi:hypothetical protein